MVFLVLRYRSVFHKTLTDIAHRADGEIAKAAVVMYVISIVLSVACVFHWSTYFWSCVGI